MTEQEMQAAVDAAKAEAETAKTEAATKATELEAQLTATREELGKLQKKDFNFRKLEDLTEGEKKKLSERELELMQRAESIENRQKELEGNTLAFYRRNALNAVAGNDPETVKALEAAWDDISGAPKTETEMMEKATKVYRLVKGTTPQFNAVTASFAQVGSAPAATQDTNKGYGDTEEGKNLAGRLGLVLEAPAKK